MLCWHKAKGQSITVHIHPAMSQCSFAPSHRNDMGALGSAENHITAI